MAKQILSPPNTLQAFPTERRAQVTSTTIAGVNDKGFMRASALGTRRLFGIGLSRTGTTSCYELIRRLGISSTHYPSSFEEIGTHLFANDSPVSARFEELDQRF